MKSAGCILLLAAVVLAALELQPAQGAVEIHVAPGGDDEFPGSDRFPLATPRAARDKVRFLRKTGFTEPINVIFARGTYYLREPLVLEAQDSGTREGPVVYRAEADAVAVLSGGVLLKPKWEPHRDGILRTAVPADILRANPSGGQLFLYGQRQHLARYPNFDPSAACLGGFAADAIGPQRAARWADPRGGLIHAIHGHQWGGFHYRITGKDAAGKLAYEGGWQNNRPTGMHRERRFVENILEELDAPGEWFLDAAAHVLYFKPPPELTLATSRFELAGLPHLVELRGTPAAPVRFVTLAGLTFTQTGRTLMETREPLLRSDWTIYRGGAVLLAGTEDCTIADATFEAVGGNAIFVDGYNRRATVRGCRIDQAGASGVCFVGRPDAVRSPLMNYNQSQPLEKIDRTPGPKSDNYPADCLVDQCLITRCGQFEKQSAGVQISMAARITVRHSSIYDLPRAGINISEGTFGGHIIEFCDVFDTVQETGDHGSFNSWGRDRFWHPDRGQMNRIMAQNPELFKLDAGETTIIRNSRWRCDHGWAIDLDDGSSNYRIYNNLCLESGLKLREGFDRVAENNVIVSNSLHPHVWFENSGDVMRKNIVGTPYHPIGMPKRWGKEADHNFLHRPGQSGPAKELYKQSGTDATSLQGDAKFVDPAKGDFRVREDSPALKLGFENFPMDQFGVTEPRLKQLARRPRLPGEKPRKRGAAEDVSPTRDGRVRDWLGGQVKNVVGLGERSAAGLPDETGVLVVAAPDGSALKQLGVQAGDVILKCNGQVTADVAALEKAHGDIAAGAKLTLEVYRNQEPLKLDGVKKPN